MKEITLKESKTPYTLATDDEFLGSKPIFLERQGKAVAVIIPIAEYEDMRHRNAVGPQISDEEAITPLARDRAAFLSMRDQLIKGYLGHYVAFKDGIFIDADRDERALVARLYEQYGAVPLYVKQVEEAETVYRLPSPRRVK